MPQPPSGGENQQGGGIGFVMFFKKRNISCIQMGVGERRQSTGRFSEGKRGGVPPKHEGRQRACAHTCVQTHT